MKYEAYKKFLTLYKDKIRFNKITQREKEKFSYAEKVISTLMPSVKIPKYTIYKIPKFLLLEEAAWIYKETSCEDNTIEVSIFITQTALNSEIAFHIILHEIIHALEVKKFSNSSIQEFFIEIFAIWITISIGECLPEGIREYENAIIEGSLLDIQAAFRKFIIGDFEYLEEEYEKLISRIKNKK